MRSAMRLLPLVTVALVSLLVACSSAPVGTHAVASEERVIG